MGKGTDTRMGALLQGLLATFTGGSLILFAVLAATIGLSTPQSDSPSITERGGSRSGGSVRVQGLGAPDENGPSTGPTTAPTTPTPPSTGSTVASTPGTTSSPPAIAAGDSDNSPPDTSAAVASTEFGLSVPDVLTPNDSGTAAGPPVGPPIRPGSFFPTTPDELPDSFRALFGAGHGLGAPDVDKADRVPRHIGRKAVRKAARTDSEAKTSGRTEKVRRPQHAGGVAASNRAHGKRSAPKHAKKTDHSQRKDNKHAKKTDHSQRKDNKHEARDQNKESKRANKDAKRESKEAKKENHGRGTAGGDHDDDDNDDDSHDDEDDD